MQHGATSYSKREIKPGIPKSDKHIHHCTTYNSDQCTGALLALLPLPVRLNIESC